MPRLKESSAEHANRMLKAYIAKNMALSEIEDNRELAMLLHMTERTFYTRKSNPNGFTRAELMKLFRALRFTPEEIVVCMT